MDPVFSSQNRQILRVLNLCIIILALACSMFFFLLIAGKGTIHLRNMPSGALVQLNGHTVSSTSIKVRPGTYQITIVSPVTTPYYAALHVNILQTISYLPTLQARSPDAIASSILGATSSSAAPHLLQVRWFNANAWLVGFVASDDLPIALHYNTSNKSWSVAFYQANGYPSSITTLPSNVAAYVQQLEAQNV